MVYYMLTTSLATHSRAVNVGVCMPHRLWSILLFNRSGTLSLFPLSQPLADSCTCSCGMSYGPRAQDGRDGLERIIAASGCFGLPCMVSSHSSRAMRWDEHPTYGWQKQPIGNTRLGAYVSCMLSVSFDSTVVSSPPVIPSSRSHQALPSQSAVQGQHTSTDGDKSRTRKSKRERSSEKEDSASQREVLVSFQYQAPVRMASHAVLLSSVLFQVGLPSWQSFSECGLF